MDAIEVVAGLIAAIVIIYRGITLRRGTWRGFERWYRDLSAPRVFRNSAFALIPIGLAIGVIPLAALAEQVNVKPLVLVLVFGFPIFGLVAIVAMIWPPSALKPAWLIAEEREGGVEAPPLRGFDLALACMVIGLAVATILAMAVLVALKVAGDAN